MSPRRLFRILLVIAAGAQVVTGGELYPKQLQPDEMLAAHNQIRSRVDAPPLTWSASLAAHAHEWALFLLRQGLFRHRPNPIYGENLYEITGGHASPAEVVGEWASEARHYDYRTNACRSGMCGHYTQIVWRGTRQVGCAVASNRGQEVWVCNYDPPGNWVGERPY